MVILTASYFGIHKGTSKNPVAAFLEANYCPINIVMIVINIYDFLRHSWVGILYILVPSSYTFGYQ